MTEAQKYEGNLYKEKPTKASKRKSVSILEPNENNALVPHKVTIEDVPPQAPTPPPAVPASNRDSVFDYMVEEEDTPDQKAIQFATEREEMSLKRDAPSVFGGSRPTSRNEYRNTEEQLDSKQYHENGFTYGAEPVHPRPANVNASTITLDYMTPAAKAAKARLDRSVPSSATHSRQNSNSEKKRKRAQTDDHASDVNMSDAPTTIVRSVVDTPGAIAHSGLTGGLQRMLSDKEDDWGHTTSSPDRDRDKQALAKLKPVKPARAQEPSPQSPLKRTRRSKDIDDAGLGISIKGRAGRVMSMIGGALSAHPETTSDQKSRRRGSSSDAHEKPSSRSRDGDRRERKKHKVTRHNGTSSANVRIEHSSRSSRSKGRHGSRSPDMSTSDHRNGNGKQKAIEYHSTSQHRAAHSPSDSDREQGNQQMVIFGEEERRRRKCDDFLAYITKGPDSGRGYSINKVLKRYHRDSDINKESDKREEEKDLWKGLRLKRNDRGEVVVFFG